MTRRINTEVITFYLLLVLLIVPNYFLRFVFWLKSFFTSTAPLLKNMTMSLEEQLTRNYRDEGGYAAGYGHYDSVWTRDSFFALLAPVSQKEERLRKLVNRLRKDANKEHQVPFTYAEVAYIPSIILGRKVLRSGGAKARYYDEKLGQPVLDANAQYIIMLHEAFLLNNNVEWLRTHATQVDLSLSWYEQFVSSKSDGMIDAELPHAGWEDSLLHTGTVAYTNFFYLEALKRADLIREALDMPTKWVSQIAALHPKIMNLVRDQRDTVTMSVAALWTKDPEVTEWMRSMVQDYPKDTLTPNRWPIAPLSHELLVFRLIGQEGYHRTFRWSWVGCLWAVALQHRGLVKEARTVFSRYEALFARYGTVHEVYDPETSTPVSRTFYQSEPCFSEGMGTFLLAKKRLSK